MSKFEFWECHPVHLYWTEPFDMNGSIIHIFYQFLSGTLRNLTDLSGILPIHILITLRKHLTAHIWTTTFHTRRSTNIYIMKPTSRNTNSNHLYEMTCYVTCLRCLSLYEPARAGEHICNPDAEPKSKWACCIGTTNIIMDVWDSCASFLVGVLYGGERPALSHG